MNQPFDLCFEKSKARKWSQVISMPAFANNRKLAEEVFSLMFMKQQFCPEVLLGKDCLVLRYWTDKVSVEWLVRSDKITYRIGAVGKHTSEERILVKDLQTTIAFMSDYLDDKFDIELRDI